MPNVYTPILLMPIKCCLLVRLSLYFRTNRVLIFWFTHSGFVLVLVYLFFNNLGRLPLSLKFKQLNATSLCTVHNVSCFHFEIIIIWIKNYIQKKNSSAMNGVGEFYLFYLFFFILAKIQRFVSYI